MWVKGHGHDVSTHLLESVYLVDVVKSTCTLHTAHHTSTVEFKVDYTYTEKYPDPNVMTVFDYGPESKVQIPPVAS